MSKIGSLVLIKIGAKTLIGQTEMGFNSVRDLIEVSNKLSGADSEYEYGRKKKSISVSGIAGTSAEQTDEGFWELYDAQEAATKVSVTFTTYTTTGATTVVPGDKIITAPTCLIGKLDTNFPDNKENKFSCELTVSGAATPTVNS